MSILQFNIVNEKIYEILGLLYKEMFQLFDPDVFHFGGDEVLINFVALKACFSLLSSGKVNFIQKKLSKFKG